MTGHYVSCAHILPPTGGDEISIRHNINQTFNRLERTAAEAFRQRAELAVVGWILRRSR